VSKVYLLSLGCDKNRVDGEVMVGTLRVAGYDVVNNPEDAAAIIINTCGFIRDAVQESIDTIFELAEYKKTGRCRALLVVGCMAERYKAEIKETLPEADAIAGVGEYDKIAEILAKYIKPAEKNPPEFAGPSRLAARRDAEASHAAYVKIAEGCDNKCTYCTIPMIRGGYRSRPEEEILEECRLLAEAGAKELILVAQDTALYGTDIYGAKKLPELLLKVAKTSGAKWIRLMYAYPEHITPALIDVMAENPEICKYLDMPIQHCENGVLSRMGRGGSKRDLEQLIRVLRDRVPGIALRTTLMVGFPGETAEDFENLFEFVKEIKFDRMGVFPYSQEEGTPAATMPYQVDEELKQERLSRLMALQQDIHFEKQRKRVGQVLPVIPDETPETSGGEYIGRTQADAYGVDALVYFSSREEIFPGQIVDVKITAADGYDLRGVAE